MNVKKQRQFTGDELRKMRTDLGISMKEFWLAMGYTLSRGCSYETGKSKIPEHVRRLVYMHYVACIPTDIDGEEFAKFETGLQEFNPARIHAAGKTLDKSFQLLSEAITELKV